jgi:hypothetical protein
MQTISIHGLNAPTEELVTVKQASVVAILDMMESHVNVLLVLTIVTTAELAGLKSTLLREPIVFTKVHGMR